MLTTYTKDQLMAQWRLRHGLEPMRGDLTVELDGIDREAWDKAEIGRASCREKVYLLV